MPLDPLMSDALLGTFRNMVQEIKEKEITGEDVDQMNAHFDRMVELAEKHSDMNAFNGEIMQENLYMKFSDHYGRALSQSVIAEQESKGYDDATLLKQSIDALKNAIKSLIQSKQDAIDRANSNDLNSDFSDGIDFAKRNGAPISKKDAIRLKKKAAKQNEVELIDKPNMGNDSVEVSVLTNIEPVVDAIQKVVDLGEQEGMTLPKFLTIQLETGMDRAMEGMVLVRDAYVQDIAFQEAYALSPYHIQKANDKLSIYDQLAKETKFNIPHNDELNFCDEKIDYKYERDIIIWEEITDRWEQIIDDISHWSLSYTSIAPLIDPWKGEVSPKLAVIETQKTYPGIIKERIRLFQKYFDIDFLSAFKHPTFKWKVEYSTIYQSQEFIEFLIETVYAKCQPFNDLDSNAINQRLQFYKEKREMNPDYDKPLNRYIAYYDNKFGDGRYLSKYGGHEYIECNAEPWNSEMFESGK